MATTQIAPAAAALAWMLSEWMTKKKPSVLGIISGAVAGLVAVTPASGFVDPTGALVIGIAAGVICFFASTSLKNALGYDDSLDAFGVHAIGGIIGAMLTGVFATKAVTGAEAAVGWIDGNPGQVLTQFYGVAVTIVYDAVVSFILLKLIDVTIGPGSPRTRSAKASTSPSMESVKGAPVSQADTRWGRQRSLGPPRNSRRISGAGRRGRRAGSPARGALYREGCRPPVKSFMFCPDGALSHRRPSRSAGGASACAPSV